MLLSHAFVFAFQLLEFVQFSSTGYGWSYPPMNLLATLCHEGSKLSLTTLFIVISQGWTITTDKVPNRSTLVPILAGTSLLEGCGIIGTLMYQDSHDAYSSRAREGGTGFCLILLQLALYYWFLTGVRKCISVESKQMSQRHGFFLAFAFCCSVWFLAEPALIILSIMMANYYRQRVLVGGSLLIQSISLCLLARLFLWRSLYFRISTMSEGLLPGARGAQSGAYGVKKGE